MSKSHKKKIKTKISKKNKLKIEENDIANLIKWVPFILFINVMPFLVKMHTVKKHPPFGFWMAPATEYVDVFGYFKLNLLYICATLAIIFLFFEYVSSNQMKVSSLNDKSFSGFFNSSPENSLARIFYKKDIIVFAAIVMIALSSILSEYKPVTYFGYRERFMGLFAWLSFFIMFFYIRRIIKDKKDIFFAVGSITLTGFVLGVIGVMQSKAHDPFRMDFFKRVIATKEIIQNNLLDTIEFTFSPTRVYMTVYNPNNVGVIVAGIVPVALYALIYGKNKILRAAGLISSVLLVVSLWGSKSRAGLVAVVVSLIVFFLLNLRTLISKKGMYRMLSIALVVIIVVGGVFAFKRHF